MVGLNLGSLLPTQTSVAKRESFVICRAALDLCIPEAQVCVVLNYASATAANHPELFIRRQYSSPK